VRPAGRWGWAGGQRVPAAGHMPVGRPSSSPPQRHARARRPLRRSPAPAAGTEGTPNPDPKGDTRETGAGPGTDAGGEGEWAPSRRHTQAASRLQVAGGLSCPLPLEDARAPASPAAAQRPGRSSLTLTSPVPRARPAQRGTRAVASGWSWRRPHDSGQRRAGPSAPRRSAGCAPLPPARPTPHPPGPRPRLRGRTPVLGLRLRRAPQGPSRRAGR
jgi:hypothetical protein